jgi:4-alpha-glucanotransferase
VKRQVLNALFATFEQHHFRKEVDHLVPCTTRAEDFARYLQREGPTLEAFALFQALYEQFSRESPPQLVWQDWPEAYRQPTSTVSQEFRATHRREIRFHQYVQWLAHQQLRRVHERTRELGMPIGLYHDLALGSDRGGSDAWIFQSILALGADCGCPPDAFAPEGQNWGLPPVNPHALRRTGYQMFIDLLRKNLQYAGAIRLDHVMALFRLFWIPRGLPPSAGAYVQYPCDDLLGILALESVRHRAVIVGEDLGTVSPVVRDKLNAAGVLSYRVFYFERGDTGEWKRPALYPRQALAVVTTHDLPTLAGFWSGEDLRVRERLGFYPDESAHRRAVDERQREKASIAQALRNEGVWPAGVDEADALRQPLSPDLMGAIHLYVARSPSSFMLITLEDFIGDSTQVNLPGTLDSYPNWSHKTLLTLEEAKESAHVRQLARAVKTARP